MAVTSSFFTGRKSWRQQGTEVKGAVNAEEAIKLAELDFKVDKRPLKAQDGEGNYTIEIPNRFSVIRTDTNQSLGVVGKRFKPLQPKECFSVADSIIGFKGNHYDSVGSINNGARLWLLLRLGGENLLGNTDDPIEKYLLFAHGNDGSLSITTAITGIRPVCENTLRLAISSAVTKFTARHTGNVGEKIDAIRDKLGLVNSVFADFEVQARRLIDTQVTGATVKSYLQSLELAPPSRDAKNDAEASKFKRLGELESYITTLFDGGAKGSDLKTARGTLWGAYNAVTEFTDHHRNPRVKDGKDDARTDSLLFGAGNDLKTKALQNAILLAR